MHSQSNFEHKYAYKHTVHKQHIKILQNIYGKALSYIDRTGGQGKVSYENK